MKTKTKGFFKISALLLTVFFLTAVTLVSGQMAKTILFDTSHGQNARVGEVYNEIFFAGSDSRVEINTAAITGDVLGGKAGLILFSPNQPFHKNEKMAIVDYLKSGGSVLLIFDEERRVSLDGVGVNGFIEPFGIKLTEDIPARHNCGAIAESSEVCAGKRELPFSGGRSIVGGTVISKVNDEGDFIHSAYLKLPAGGKIIVMSDGMAGLLLGGPDGVRFSGTGPSDSKYWGKDSQVFMEEILAFLLKSE